MELAENLTGIMIKLREAQRERERERCDDDREKVYRYTELLFRGGFQCSRDAVADEGGGVPSGVPGHVVLLLILILVKEVEKLEGWHEEG